MAKIKKVFLLLLIFTASMAALFYVDSNDAVIKGLYGLAAMILYLAYVGQKQLSDLQKEKRYRCTFEKQIIAHDSDDVLVTLKIDHTLSFLPFPGLSITDSKNPMPENCADPDNFDDEEFFTGEIETVGWRYSKFICQVKPHKMSQENVLGAVVAGHYEYAWKIDLFFPGLKRDLEDYITEQEAELAKKPADDERAEQERFELDVFKKRLARR